MRRLLPLLLLGCSGGGLEAKPEWTPTREPDKVVVIEAPPPPPRVDGEPVEPGATAVPVQLRFFTIGKLHQGFFTQREGIAELGRGLAECTAHTVEVDVTYDNDTRIGRIVARIPPDSTTCAPRVVDGALDASPAIPIARALSKWRSWVAGTSDLRIESFEVAVDFRRDVKSCELLAKGQHPPTGETFSRCVRHAGQEVCAPGPKSDGVTRLELPPDALKYAASCY